MRKDYMYLFTIMDWELSNTLDTTFRLKFTDITISMDGKGRWLDNGVIERVWRSIKYEDIYLNSYETSIGFHREIRSYISSYNRERPHQSLGYATSNEVYDGKIKLAV